MGYVDDREFDELMTRCREAETRIAELEVTNAKLHALIDLEILLGELDPSIATIAAFARGVIATVEDLAALAAPSAESEER